MGCVGLSDITIPDNVKQIGDWAFYQCGGITGVTISEGVESIGEGAFMECAGLTDITIPGSVKQIGPWAFDACGGITGVTIPEGVVSLGVGAFGDCGNLESISFPASLTSIEGNPVYISNDTISSSLVALEVSPGNPRYEAVDGALFDKQDKTLVAYPTGREGAYAIPEGVEHIGLGAFVFATGLPRSPSRMA